MSSIYLAKKILKRPYAYTPLLQEQSGYKERQVRECTREICIMLNSVQKKLHLFDHLYKKYSSPSFGRVALIPEMMKAQA